ncbi:MFS transporter, partial [Klebsiella michiganensis]
NVGIVYSSKGLAAIIMPAIMGIVADKWLRAERAYMLCHLVCAGVLLYATTVTDPETMFWVMLINAMAYMPTISLSNSISYSCLAQSGQDPATAFPPVRVFGTLGFIVAMWTVSLMRLELSSAQLYIASAASLLLAIYALTLPKIPVTEKKPGTTLATRLGLDAFVLFKNPRMAIFFFFAMMLGAVLQITNVFGNPFLHDFARNPAFADSFVVRYPSILLSVSQMAEVAFILT